MKLLKIEQAKFVSKKLFNFMEKNFMLDPELLFSALQWAQDVYTSTAEYLSQSEAPALLKNIANDLQNAMAKYYCVQLIKQWKEKKRAHCSCQGGREGCDMREAQASRNPASCKDTAK